MLKNSSTADIPLQDLQCQILIGLPDCQHVFLGSQNILDPLKDGIQKDFTAGTEDKFCDHSACP